MSIINNILRSLDKMSSVWVRAPYNNIIYLYIRYIHTIHIYILNKIQHTQGKVPQEILFHRKQG